MPIKFTDIRHTLAHILAACATAGLTVASPPAGAETMQDCLMRALSQAQDRTTVGELRQGCEAELDPSPKPNIQEPIASTPEQLPGLSTDSAVDRRLSIESRIAESSFAITPYRPNYLLFGSYNTSTPNEAPFDGRDPDEDLSLDRLESKFQISFKFPMWRNLFDSGTDLMFGYTNRSFWQVYNKSFSSPFRESDHEVEAWLRFKTDLRAFGFRNNFVSLGFDHQSNGRPDGLSRSWNRIFAQLVFEKDDFYFGLRPWVRIQESADNDDNPDIEDYMGNVEFQGLYKRGEHTFGLMLRNNFQSENNRGAVQLDWSFPLKKPLRGYLQWFNGYGESLLDYDANVNAIGFGIQLTDWL